jgi:hypothetical protein
MGIRSEGVLQTSSDLALADSGPLGLPSTIRIASCATSFRFDTYKCGVEYGTESREK